MARFPPPMAPGAGQVLWDALGEVEEGPLLDFVEVFAGHAAVSRAFQSLGYRGRRMDLKYHEGHDVLNPTGLLLLLSSVMDLKPGGILWAAPPVLHVGVPLAQLNWTRCPSGGEHPEQVGAGAKRVG